MTIRGMVDTVSPVVIGSIIILLGLAFGAHAIARRRAVRRHGRALVPADIQDLCANIGRRTFTIVSADFMIAKERKRRRLLERTYQQPDGVWTLQIEMDEDRVVAFEARFASAHTWLLTEMRGGKHGDSIFFAPD